MDGKKELVFQINARHRDGTLIDFDNQEHRQKFNKAYISGIESVGYKCELVQGSNQGAI